MGAIETHITMPRRSLLRRRVVRLRVGCIYLVLDGVFECRNDLLQVGWQRRAPFHDRPDGHWWRLDDGAVELNRVKIIVQEVPTPAMNGIARLPDSGTAIPPGADSTEVRAPLVGEKHIGAPVDALRVTLQAPRTPRQRLEIGIVGDDNEKVNVLGIRFGCDDRAEHRNASHARNLPRGHDEPAETVEQGLAVKTMPVDHGQCLNPAVAPR